MQKRDNCTHLNKPESIPWDQLYDSGPQNFLVGEVLTGPIPLFESPESKGGGGTGTRDQT